MNRTKSDPEESITEVLRPVDVIRGETAAGDLLNREVGWLEFNRRVLHEAEDERNPLLERLRFLGISASNLDEFFMKRVGGLKRHLAAGVITRSPDGFSPTEQLIDIRKTVLPMIEAQVRCFEETLVAKLASSGVSLLTWEQLNQQQCEFASRYFQQKVFPVLTPLAVDPGHPFPFISNLSTSIGVTVRHPLRDEILFTRIEVPAVLPQWIRLEGAEGDSSFAFIPLHEIIRNNLSLLLPETQIVDSLLFRVTRNADIERDEEDAEDLLEMIEEELRQRRFANVVRLEHSPTKDPWMLRLLLDELELGEDDVYEIPGELDYSSLKPICELNLPKLKFDSFSPVLPIPLADPGVNFFSLIRNGDLLVHHPYESFTGSVQRFVQTAVNDPLVLAIKMTVYRTGADSPFIPLLIEAAEKGKQVVCLVELKARFEEQRNIFWAQELEKAGAHVVYGLVGLKTHAKTILVVRSEPDELRCYAHIATGNYHAQTSNLYTDLGMFTCNKLITDDLVEVFNYLTGRSLRSNYKKLLVAPVNMKERFLEMIEREKLNAEQGLPAEIIAKTNSLEEHSIIRALYRASQAGVKIRLLVRGFSSLRPGVAGLSENIEVISSIGRLLEHSRTFYFRNGQSDPLEGEFYLGSADWMYRNLLARVEVITPVMERGLREKIWEILQLMLQDRRSAWDMLPDGSYVQRQPTSSDEEQGIHERLIALYKKRQVSPISATAT